MYRAGPNKVGVWKGTKGMSKGNFSKRNISLDVVHTRKGMMEL
jgi:hypothetical protein